MTDPYNSRTVLFCGAEVKMLAGDGHEAIVQLILWLAAVIRKFQDLHRSALSNIKKQGPNCTNQRDLGAEYQMPVIGWTICGHSWHLFVAWPADGGTVS